MRSSSPEPLQTGSCRRNRPAMGETRAFSVRVLTEERVLAPFSPNENGILRRPTCHSITENALERESRRDLQLTRGVVKTVGEEAFNAVGTGVVFCRHVED